MSAFRNARSIPPSTLAHQYRLNIAPRKQPPNVVGRTRKVKDDVIHINIDNNHLDHDVYERNTSRSSYLDEEEENDFYFRCDSPQSPRHGIHSPVKIYELACKKHNLIPLNSIKKGLMTTKVALQSTQLNYNECKCICFGLYHTMNVESIEFEHNGLGHRCTQLFAEVVCQNPNITHIKLAHNNLKSAGTKALCEAIEGNQTVLSLDLTGNGLVESDGEYIRSLIENADCLIELYLGHNALSDKGIISIAEALKDSKTLRLLDLKWNHIRLQGALAIGAALEENTSLETVNLAWNGLHKEGATSIANALRENQTLLELDLTCNRLTEECIATILTGMKENNTLETLHIGQNQISTRGALCILQHIYHYNKTSALKYLDFGNLEVHDTFEKLYKEMKQDRDIEVKYGPVWSTDRKPLNNDECDDEQALLNCNPLTVLMECMRLQNLRLIDFFKSLDSDNSNMLCINELCDGMIKVGVPIRRRTLIRLLRKLDKDDNGKLDYAEMIQAQNLHRQNVRKVFGVPGVEFEQTEIGKVSMLLRKIMSTNFIMKKSDTRRTSRNPALENTATENPAAGTEETEGTQPV